MVCLLFVFWTLGFSINGFLIKIVFTLILKLTFITFIIYFIVKLYIFINVFMQNLAQIFHFLLVLIWMLTKI